MIGVEDSCRVSFRRCDRPGVIQKLTEFFSRAGLPAPRPALELGSIPLALTALREGNLISFLPEILVRQDLSDGTLHQILPELTWERAG